MGAPLPGSGGEKSPQIREVRKHSSAYSVYAGYMCNEMALSGDSKWKSHCGTPKRMQPGSCAFSRCRGRSLGLTEFMAPGLGKPWGMIVPGLVNAGKGVIIQNSITLEVSMWAIAWCTSSKGRRVW